MRREHEMGFRMGVRALLLAVAFAAVSAASAAAGPPIEGTIREPLSNVPTGACVSFAPGDVLTFTGLTARYDTYREWSPEEGTYLIRYTNRFSATATSGIYSYALDATLHFTGGALMDFSETGQTRIHRSDGRNITGRAHIYYDHFLADYRLEWLSNPTGVDCH